MADAVDLCRVDGGQHRLHIDAGGGQQGLAQALPQIFTVDRQIGMLHVKDLPHQGESVGVEAGGGQGQHHVPGADPVRVDDIALVHDAHGKARQVVVLRRHDAGVLGGLAADEGAARLDAALCYAGDNGGHLLRHILADGDVVQKEQGLCPAADDVVDAHGHAVHAHGVVPVQQLGDADFGAHPIGAGHQHRLTYAGQVRGEQPAKAPNAGHYPGDPGPGHVGGHQLHTGVACGDVHAGLPVALRITLHIRSSPSH